MKAVRWHAEDAERANQQPCFVHTPAAKLYQTAAARAKGLLGYLGGDDMWGSGVPISHVLYYEEVQQDSVMLISTLALNPDNKEMLVGAGCLRPLLALTASGDLSF